MQVQLKKFGKILISRPAGREAWLATQAYILPKSISENIEVSFSGVEVITPSWADEFITPLRKKYGNRVQLLDSNNPTVQATLKTINK